MICRVPCLFKYRPLILCYGEVKHLQTSLIVFMIVTEARSAVPYTFPTPLSLSLYHHPLSFKQIAHVSVLSFLHISTCFYELFDIVCIFKLGFIVFSCFKSLLLQLRLLLLLLMLSLMLRLRSFYQMKMKIIIIKKQSKHWCIVCLVHDISLYRTSCTNTSQRGQKDFGMIDIIAI